MNERPIFFIAFQEQDNLGVGYLASILLNAGYKIKIIDFQMGPEVILQQIRENDPLIVGFSVIFQYHIDEFKDLIDFLRVGGVQCHLCAGGHFPSLRYRDLLDFIPGLNSVVLFEGEHTFLEMVRAIDAGTEWRNIRGIAYKENGECRATPLRPLEEDLDIFPPPARPPLREYALGKKYVTLLAGRGCVFNCSYCSVREFYSRPPGRVKRVRRPEMVVREMELLHQQKGASVFVFQDDDFPIAWKKEQAWVREFMRLLNEKGLYDRIMLKINCRPDEVEKGLFTELKDCGLFLVYLGIESGTDEGLRLMNKKVDVETNIRAVRILNELNIDYDYGFMLFDPSSTLESVRRNLDFLREICADGSTPVTFCKMLPYAETRVEAEMRNSGRLIGNPGFQDYAFLDTSLDLLFSDINSCFFDWIMDHEGVNNVARWTKYRLAVYRRYYEADDEYHRLAERTRLLIAASNHFMLDKLVWMCDRYRSSPPDMIDFEVREQLKDEINEAQTSYKQSLNELFDQIENLAQQSVSGVISN